MFVYYAGVWWCTKALICDLSPEPNVNRISVLSSSLDLIWVGSVLGPTLALGVSVLTEYIFRFFYFKGSSAC